MFLVCISALIALSPVKEPQLLEVAKLITKVVGWKEGLLTVGMYCWLSPTQIVAFLEGHSEQLIDIKTKAVTPFAAPAWQRHQFWFVSPDRTKVIHQDYKGDRYSWRITDRLGIREFGAWSMATPKKQRDRSTLYGYPAPEATWSQDGKSVYQIDYRPKGRELEISMCERPLARPNWARTFPTVSGDFWQMNLHIIRDRAILCREKSQNVGPYEFRSWELSKPNLTRREWKVPAPKGHKILTFVPSPDGNTALWEMAMPGPKAFDGGGYPYSGLSLWKSGINGENLKMVGKLDFKAKNNDERMSSSQHFGELMWNPDSKHVSFIYNRKLYLVRV